MRLFGEGEISEKSKLVGLQIAGAAKAAIGLDWKERVCSLSVRIGIEVQKRLRGRELRLGGTLEPLPASSTSPIARMTTDAPTLVIASSWVFGALATSASAYGSGGRPVFGSPP